MKALRPIVVGSLWLSACAGASDGSVTGEGAMGDGSSTGGRGGASAVADADGLSGSSGTAGTSDSGTRPPLAVDASGARRVDAGEGDHSPSASPFKLLWRDEFDTFNATRWQKASHEFPENAAQFTPDNAVVEGGYLKLRITNTPRNGHAYSAADVYTNETFTFGRFEARIRFAAGSGIVSSLFTYRDESNVGWNEIDIEHLGHLADAVQFNLISSPAGGGTITYQPKVVNTGFRPTEGFHDYAFEWTPSEIRFYVDRELLWRDVQPRLSQASRLRMNIWPTNNAKTTFAGTLDPSKIPAEAEYDWVAAYAYQP